MAGTSTKRSRRLLDVVRPPRDDAPDTTAIVLHAGGTGVLAAVVGIALALLLTVAAWALAPHGDAASPAGPMRIAAAVWLVAHHVALDLPQGVLSVSPLGLLLVPLGLTYLAGRQAARALIPRTLGDVGRAVVVLALGYGMASAVVAGVVRSDDIRPHTWQAFVAGALLALVGGGWGLLRGADLVGTLWAAIPVRARSSLSAATAALLTLFGLSAVVLAVLLAIGFPDALEITRSLRADTVGGLLLAVLALAFIPSLVVWSAAFMAGPGFVLGTQTQVSVQGVDYGALPLFAPLAALPPEGRPGPAALLVLLVPLAAGVVAGVVVHRRTAFERPEQAAAIAAAAGVVAGVGFAFLAWLSSGSVGSGRLATVGPSWATGVVVAVEIGLTAAVVAWELHRRTGHVERHISLP